ncbi:hypothetical protein [Pragia fontium]|uniref:Copper resistance protein n=1 Tax=Pragia fontium TaxID=82985 RepID=A0ABQ5LIR8_9GAMM|nr:hypothetical protein [Pragia fontium]AKJ42468.1 copper resistance protein [Pragia fontium]GKX62722.1 copper resistance protein [Pragia fontium]
MAQQQRIAKWFLILACLLVLVCTAQRMASLHMLSKYSSSDTAALVQAQDDQSQSTSPCELSAKSLLAANSMAGEHLFFALLLFITLLLEPARQLRLLIPPLRAVSLPRLRVHLRLCIFRE